IAGLRICLQAWDDPPLEFTKRPRRYVRRWSVRPTPPVWASAATRHPPRLYSALWSRRWLQIRKTGNWREPYDLHTAVTLPGPHPAGLDVAQSPQGGWTMGRIFRPPIRFLQRYIGQRTAYRYLGTCRQSRRNTCGTAFDQGAACGRSPRAADPYDGDGARRGCASVCPGHCRG